MKKKLIFVALILLFFQFLLHSQQPKWILGSSIKKENGDLNTPSTNLLNFYEVDMTDNSYSVIKRNVGQSIKDIFSIGLNEAINNGIDSDGNVSFYVFVNTIDPYAALAKDDIYFVHKDPSTGFDEVFHKIATTGQGANSVRNIELVKDDNNEGKYLVIYKNSATNSRAINDIYYVIVDINNLSVTNPILLASNNLNEGMAISNKNCDGKRWLLFSRSDNNKYEIFKAEISNGSIKQPISAYVNNSIAKVGGGQGDFDISPDNKTLAHANFSSNENHPNEVFLFDFNIESGNISNYRYITNPFGNAITLCFSPDSKRIYVGQGGASGLQVGLYNTPISPLNSTIKNNEKVMLSLSQTPFMELTSQDEIYIAENSYQNKIITIENPNEAAENNQIYIGPIDHFGINNAVGIALPDQVNGTYIAQKNNDLDFTICPNGTITLNDITYTQPGMYQQTLQTIGGCDSIINIKITESQSKESNLTYSLCPNETITINDITYNQEGIYTQTLLTSDGCDSILNIVIENSCISENIYKINASNIEVIPLPNIINGTYPAVDVSSVTKPLILESFNNNFQFFSNSSIIHPSSGNKSDVIFGGDGPGELGWGGTSIFLNQSFDKSDFPICIEADFYNENNTAPYNESYLLIGPNQRGNYNSPMNQFPNGNSQEGIVVGGPPNMFLFINLNSINDPRTEIIRKNISSISYANWNKYKACFDVSNDSLFLTDFYHNNNPYPLNNKVYAGNTPWLDNFTLGINADDLAKDIKITKFCEKFGNLDLSFCPNQSITINNITYNQEGTFIQNLIANNGCDSTLTITISMNESKESFHVYTLCPNETVTVNNITYDQEGTYTQNLTAQNGCDSILTITIFLKESKESFQEFSICENESISINNISYNQQGTYTQNLTANNGCDSILTIEIIIKENTTSEQSHAICPGDIITVNGMEYNDVGSYSQTLTNSLGCDSTLVININPSNNCIIECTIIAELVNVSCDDNNTPFDPTDDTFYSNVLVSGSDITTHWTSNDNLRPVGNYNSVVTFGPYPISNGAIDIQFSDAINICETTLQITPPTSCSDLCIINTDIIDITCNDNGSPGNPNDDTYTAVVGISSTNGSASWTSDDNNNQSGVYGVTSFGPYNISNGDTQITFTDASNNNCPVTINLSAPLSCSESCEIHTEIIDIICDDNQSQNIPDDDLYYVTLKVSGSNLSGNWNADDLYLSSGQNDVEVTIGPYSITQGDFYLRIADADYDQCYNDLLINAPAPCSQTCELQVTTSIPYCDDNGTESDPFDDQFYFDVNVEAINASESWYSTGAISYTQNYLQGSVRFGPINISEGEINLQIIDGENSECYTALNIVAPATCSPQCALNATVTNIRCDDSGSETDSSDDVFYFDALVEISNGGGIWYSDDASKSFGSYFSTTTFGPYPISNGDVTININDEDFTCSTIINIAAPSTCSDKCELALKELDIKSCIDNNTPSNNTDDVFSTSFKIEGKNNSTQCRVLVDAVEYGIYNYNETIEIQNLQANGISKNINIEDIINSECNLLIEVNRESCSVDCPPPFREEDVQLCTSTKEFELTTTLTNIPASTWTCKSGPEILAIADNKTDLSNKPTGIYLFQLKKENYSFCDSVISELRLTLSDTIHQAINAKVCESYNWDGQTLTESGQYHYKGKNSYGCDSTVTLNLTIPSTFHSELSTEKCDSYHWNGNTYSESGKYTFAATTIDGCDSIETLNLTINKSKSNTIYQTSCKSFLWNGNEYNVTGLYTFATQTAAGCDSVVTLDLAISDEIKNETSLEKCDSYQWNGNTYNESGAYTFAATTIDGCDSIETLNLTINKSKTNTIYQTSCKSFSWNGTNYNATGIYTFALQSTAGCDSVVTLNLAILYEIRKETSLAICDSYNWNGNTYNESGAYTFAATTIDGCDSIETLNLTVNKSKSNTIYQTSCKSFLWNGNEYNATGIYTFATQTAAGCDSLVTLDLAISDEIKNESSLAICDSYNWNGNTYIESGSYTFAATTIDGCDSIETLNLTINKSVNNTIYQTSCKSFLWNGNEYNAPGIYTFATQTAAGCDSVVTLDLAISDEIKNETFLETCDSYQWNGNTYNESGAYTFAATTIDGCDSIETLNLTINKSKSNTIYQTSCKSFLWNGNEYNATGIYTFETQTAAGCDSVLTLDLAISDEIKNETSLEKCDSYQWNGNIFFESGTYTFETMTVDGCDSIETLNLTINSNSHHQYSTSICEGDSIFLFDDWIQEDGLYSQTYQSINGCDSIETVELIVNPLVVKSDSIKICEGDNVVINGKVYDKEGSYQTILPSSEGCNTIYNFELKYSSLVTKTENYSICEGDSILINGVYISTSTSSVYFVQEENCKTEITANVTINQKPITNNRYTLCPNDSILINNTWIKESTDLTYTMQSATGCDSIIQVSITKTENPNPPIVELNCEEVHYTISIDNEDWQAEWSNGSTDEEIIIDNDDLEVASFISLSLKNNHSCEVNYELSLEKLPILDDIPQLQNQYLTQAETIEINVELEEADWKIKWISNEIISCDTCFETTIQATENTTVDYELENKNGCTYNRSFDIIIEENENHVISIPNVIAPNSTNGNNVWAIDLPDGYNIEEVKIYDRWGNVVYSVNGIGYKPIPSWDGKLNGESVVAGVYVYIIRFINTDGNVQMKRGDITVIR